MPAVSGKQYRLMQMVAHGKKARVGGPSKEVARKFIEHTSTEDRKKFSHKGKK